MSETKPKYGIGDKVKIVNFGHLIWQSKIHHPETKLPVYKEEEKIRWVDIRPDYICLEGLVKDVDFNQGVYSYNISNVGAWHTEDQMELISKNPNNLTT